MISYQMVQATLNELKIIVVRDFSSTKKAADNFIKWANNKLEVEKSEVEISDGFL
jgi:hypothetical protein